MASWSIGLSTEGATGIGEDEGGKSLTELELVRVSWSIAGGSIRLSKSTIKATGTGQDEGCKSLTGLEVPWSIARWSTGLSTSTEETTGTGEDEGGKSLAGLELNGRGEEDGEESRSVDVCAISVACISSSSSI